jgi:Skp family chaperone for outer membrane proteins
MYKSTLLKLTLTALALIVFNLAANAQATAPTQSFAPAKVATINSALFNDEKAGITRLLKAYAALEAELQPKATELQNLQAQISKVGNDLQALQDNAGKNPAADPRTQQAAIDAKTDEGTRLQLEFKRKQEDGKSFYDRRSAALINPVVRDIGAALDAYARKRGIDIVIDLAKSEGTVVVASSSVDITQAFITDFNAQPAKP